jgi:hypothetical protein
MIQMLVYDRHSKVLGELNGVNNVSRSYVLNKSGALTFTIGMRHPKAKVELLDHGNIIIVYSDILPTWQGFITRLNWSGENINVTATSIEQRLGRRRTRPTKITNEAAGYHFAHLVNEANAREHTGIYLDTVYNGGPNLTLEYQSEKTYDKIDELITMAKMDWRLVMEVPGHWMLSLYERYGRDLTGQVAIIAGVDTSDAPEYDEDTVDYVNDVTAVGKPPDDSGHQGEYTPEEDWARKPKAYFTDPVQIDKHGLSEEVIELSETDDIATLLTAATAEGVKRSQPSKPVSLSLNMKRGLWNQFEEGDTVVLHIPNYRFSGLAVPFRVLGREVNEDQSVMALAGEVVVGDAATTLNMYQNMNYGTV